MEIAKTKTHPHHFFKVDKNNIEQCHMVLITLFVVVVVGEVVIGEYSPRRSGGEYSLKIIKSEVDNRLSIFTQVNLQKK